VSNGYEEPQVFKALKPLERTLKQGGFRKMVEYSDKYLALTGGRFGRPKRVPHWEHWSCPDAETYITGIDFYEHPRLCRLRMVELYPS
jgi:hypothetical protein